MGTARLFDNILKEELNIHAAWLPVTNTFEIGDFGLVSDGVLVKMGNISDHGVDYSEEAGPPSSLNFASEGTHIIRAVAGAQVDVLPDGDLDAKLTIQFDQESSFLIKANLAVRQMRSLQEVARTLARSPGWENRLRVVSAVYTGKHCVILSSKGANSKIELVGKATALKQFEIGAVTAEVQRSSSEKIGLDIVGKTGVVGLALFKLNWLTGRPQLLGADDEVPIEESASRSGELPDDV